MLLLGRAAAALLGLVGSASAQCVPAPMSSYSLTSTVSSVPAVGHDLSGVSINSNGNLYFVRDNGDGWGGTGTLSAGDWSPSDGGAAGSSGLQHPALWEYSFTANSELTMVREIELVGFDDVEAVVWMDGDRVAVLEEERMKICVLDLSGITSSQTVQREYSDCQSLVSISGIANETSTGGGEGLAWDSDQSEFLVGKERDPLAIFSIPLQGPGPSSFTTTTNTVAFNTSASGSQQTANNGLHLISETGQVMTLDYGAETVCVQGSTPDCLALGLSADDGHTYLNGVTLVPRGNFAPDILVVSEPTILLRYQTSWSCSGDTAVPTAPSSAPDASAASRMTWGRFNILSLGVAFMLC